MEVEPLDEEMKVAPLTEAHVVIGGEGLLCKRCGRTRPVRKLPASVESVVEDARRFDKRHRNCPEPADGVRPPERPELSEIEARALAAVAKSDGSTTGWIGWLLWGETTESPNRGDGSHSANKFARSAGKVLGGLERRGLVRSHLDRNDYLARWGWHVTEKGRRSLPAEETK